MLSLTREERKVIIFLFAVALVGVGLNFLGKRYSLVQSLAYPADNILKSDLNQADKEKLMEVSGIGEKLAQRILEYRRQNGNFTSAEDLKKIKGITTCRYNKLRELFFVE